jgi:hypothetical protein
MFEMLSERTASSSANSALAISASICGTKWCSSRIIVANGSSACTRSSQACVGT